MWLIPIIDVHYYYYQLGLGLGAAESDNYFIIQNFPMLNVVAILFILFVAFREVHSLDEDLKCPDKFTKQNGRCVLIQENSSSNQEGSSSNQLRVEKCEGNKIPTAFGCIQLRAQIPEPNPIPPTPLVNSLHEEAVALHLGPIPAQIDDKTDTKTVLNVTTSIQSKDSNIITNKSTTVTFAQPVVPVRPPAPNNTPLDLTIKNQSQTANTPILEPPTAIPSLNLSSTSANPSIPDIQIQKQKIELSIHTSTLNQSIIPHSKPQQNTTAPSQPVIPVTPGPNTSSTQTPPVEENKPPHCSGVKIEGMNLCLPISCPKTYEWNANTSECQQPKPLCDQSDYVWNGKYCVPPSVLQSKYPSPSHSQQLARELTCPDGKSECMVMICPSGFTYLGSTCLPTHKDARCPVENINDMGFCNVLKVVEVRIKPGCVNGKSIWNGTVCEALN